MKISDYDHLTWAEAVYEAVERRKKRKARTYSTGYKTGRRGGRCTSPDNKEYTAGWKRGRKKYDEAN